MIVLHRVDRRLISEVRMILVLLGVGAIGVPLIVGAQGLTFEVASIKEARPPMEYVQAGQFHVGVNVNGLRAEYGFVSLADLIPYAYRVKRFQLSGPSWMGDRRWDILAKIPDSQSAVRAPEMMQSLLAERFKLQMHRENREQSVYALVVGKDGLKIKEATADDEGVGGLDVRINNDAIAISGGGTGPMRLTASPDGGMQMQMAKITMVALADRLTQFLDRPVVDATELKGNYQVTLNVPVEAMAGMAFAQKLAALAGLGSFGTAGGSSAPDTSVSIVQAVKALGLDLQSRKAPVETITVDRLEKAPTAN
jgi:uncharacterized protein (TIGR03435 family)